MLTRIHWTSIRWRVAALAAAIAAAACVRGVEPTAVAAPLPTGNVDAREPIAAGGVLWFVDGREVSAEAAGAMAPDTIRSVEVLKGRAAVSRYGRRAANGAVVVTTTRPGAASR